MPPHNAEADNASVVPTKINPRNDMKRTPPLNIHRILWLTLTVTVALLLTGSAFAQDDPPVGDPAFAAPNFAPNLEWVNVDGQLTLDDMQGKVVLLDFWTYGCINCLHMIPVYKQLEEKYPDELVVVGIHSAKFENEGETRNIQEIVQRYGITHPVVNDNQFIMWQMYERFLGQRLAWPTLVLIDPRGNVLAAQSGEIPFEPLDSVIGQMVTYFDTQGELSRAPIDKIQPELNAAPPRALNYPGKVLADEAGKRLFIADSVNHRIVIADLDTYDVLDVIGTGAQGYTDGGYDEAQFYKPQGMALRDEVLYIADTFNHTLRAANLTEQTVTTIAGTGVQGRTIPQAETFPALATGLRSPWDVAFGAGDTLFVAMAGTHQIWEYDITTMTLSYSVGNGREAQLNRSPRESELAQPSGLYYVDEQLYFADSESSTIRVADFAADRLRVVSGTTENSLFDYGDVDGPPGESRLQHALGVTGDGEGTLYLADTYNSKIKAVMGEDEVTTTLFGGDEPGYADGGPDEARFNEPGGLDYADGLLYVADTNNHVIRVIDLDAETVSTVTFPNPEALQIDGRATVIAGNTFTGAELLPEQTVAAGEGDLTLNIVLPEGYKINDLAPSRAVVESQGGALTVEQRETTIETTQVSIPVTLAVGDDVLFGSFDVYYCEAVNESLCFVEQFAVEVPVVVRDDADATQINVERQVTPPEPSGVAGFTG